MLLTYANSFFIPMPGALYNYQFEFLLSAKVSALENVKGQGFFGGGDLSGKVAVHESAKGNSKANM